MRRPVRPRASTFPRVDYFHHHDGRLWCEDVPLRTIAAVVGTPVYIYSTATMARHAAVMKAAIAGCGNGEPLVAYAVKANPNPAVLATLCRSGLGADVVSVGEYARALAAGIPPDRIVFSGVGKTDVEMAAALAGGLLQFNVESLPEARTLSAVARSFPIYSIPLGVRRRQLDPRRRLPDPAAIRARLVGTRPAGAGRGDRQADARVGLKAGSTRRAL